MTLPDGLHIATIVSVWSGSTVGGVPITRLRMEIPDEPEVVQRTLAGHQARRLFNVFQVSDPKTLQNTRWIVKVEGREIDLVRPA